ncbi:MAG TPA: hypothetical protein VL966_12405 [Alphaproteobacteria bacterium]|jgi:hypothetical protein|nr:hypothetical protein [Alphaproteobacteria bacterium]
MAPPQRPRTKPQAAKAPPRRAAAPQRKAARTKTPIMGNMAITLVLVVLMFAMLPTALILVVGGLPTLVAFIVDRHKKHLLTRCVGSLNLAGILPYLLKIWTHHTTLAAVQMLTDPLVWLVMYGGAAVGWVIFLSAPSIAWLQVEITGSRRVKALRARQKQLLDEWGNEVAHLPGAGTPPQTTPAA